MTTAPRCYLTEEVCDKLQLSPRMFFRLKAAGKLPMLEELPRLDRRPRYRADLIDHYLATGQLPARRSA